MLYLIEGARNSGKTYVSSFFSSFPTYKFPFTKWFEDLEYDDSKKETHDFALGKEIMLLDLNKNGFIENMLCDRSIITVFVWAILSGRISERRAEEEFEMILNDGLLNNVRMIWVKGQNPSSLPRQKDFWDIRDSEKEKEEVLFKSFFQKIKMRNPEVEIHEIENTFDERVKEQLENLKNVWNIN